MIWIAVETLHIRDSLTIELVGPWCLLEDEFLSVWVKVINLVLTRHLLEIIPRRPPEVPTEMRPCKYSPQYHARPRASHRLRDGELNCTPYTYATDRQAQIP